MITIFGDNHYAIDLELTKIKGEFAEKYPSFNLQKIYSEQIDIEEIRLIFNNYSIFSEPQLILIYDLEIIPNFEKVINELSKLRDEEKEIVLILKNNKINSKQQKLLEKKSQTKVLKKLSDNEIIRWMKKLSEAYKLSLSDSEIRYIYQKIGNDQLQIATELEKLSLLNQKITKDVIDLLINSNLNNSVFELIDFAFKDKIKAYQVYNNLRLQKIDPEQIIALITWQLHLIAIMKYSKEKSIKNIIEETKLNRFSLEKSLLLSKQITKNNLKTYIYQLKNAEIISKTESFDLDQFLKNFILNIT
jgi:DNA polymerase III delta subunit